MPNELLVRQDGIGGLVEDNPLTSGATTLTSAGLAALVAIGATQFAWVILDPEGMGGAPEHVKITAHTASATSATLLRGQNGTTARQHESGIRWVHGPIAADFTGDTSWSALTLTNSWVDYGTPFPTPGYRKMGDGLVLLKGTLKNGTLGAAMFTLPVGYRPIGQIGFASDNGGSHGVMEVKANGEVTASTGSNIYVRLDVVRFLAEA